MLFDSITLLNGGAFRNAAIESGTTLPSTGNSTTGELFYLTSGTPGMYLYNGSAWNIIPLTVITKTSQLTNDSGFLTSSSLSGYATTSSLSSYAPLASPTFTGTPAVPTATSGTNTTQAASTAFVVSATQGQLGISLDGFSAANSFSLNAAQAGYSILQFTGTLGGNPTVTFPTSGRWIIINSASDGGNGFQVKITNGSGTTYTLVNGNTYFMVSEGTSGLIQVASTVAATLTSTQITNAGGALLASPNFTGTPTVPTATAGTNTTQAASTAFVQNAVSGLAPTASPTLTGRAQSDAYSYTVSALGSVSGTKTMDLAAAGEFTMTIAGATTFAFTNTLSAGRSEVVYLRITNGGSATITWPASTKFASGTAPTLTASGTDLLGVKYDTTTSTYMVFVIGLAIA
jgi:hypothetical protein